MDAIIISDRSPVRSISLAPSLAAFKINKTFLRLATKHAQLGDRRTDVHGRHVFVEVRLGARAARGARVAVGRCGDLVPSCGSLARHSPEELPRQGVRIRVGPGPGEEGRADDHR